MMPMRPPVHRPMSPAGRTYVPQVRESAASRGYGWRWRLARRGFLAAHPLCAQCSAEGVVRAATVVDHIIPHKGDQALFWDRSNWQPLCKAHHDRKTAREDGGFGNTRHEIDGSSTCHAHASPTT